MLPNAAALHASAVLGMNDAWATPEADEFRPSDQPRKCLSKSRVFNCGLPLLGRCPRRTMAARGCTGRFGSRPPRSARTTAAVKLPGSQASSAVPADRGPGIGRGQLGFDRRPRPNDARPTGRVPPGDCRRIPGHALPPSLLKAGPPRFEERANNHPGAWGPTPRVGNGPHGFVRSIPRGVPATGSRLVTTTTPPRQPQPPESPASRSWFTMTVKTVGTLGLSSKRSATGGGTMPLLLPGQRQPLPSPNNPRAPRPTQAKVLGDGVIAAVTPLNESRAALVEKGVVKRAA